MKKYELLTNDTITINGHKLFRIKALKDFNDVKKGDLGGYIESENNLSQDGTAWAYGTSKIFDNALIYSNAQIYGEVQVFDNARVCDNARVFNNAQVYGSALISENAVICDFAKIYGYSNIYDNAKVYGDAKIHGNADISGTTEICNSVEIGGNAEIRHPIIITDSKQILTIGYVGLKNSSMTFIYDLKSRIIYVSIEYFNDTIDAFISQLKNGYTNKVYTETHLQTIKYARNYFQTVFGKTSEPVKRKVDTMEKYELLTNDTIMVNGHKLFRIKALKDFANVKKGDLGGYIENKGNLSQKGISWVFDTAQVYDNARVYENAQISDKAQIYNCSKIYGNARVKDKSQIYDEARIYGNSQVYDNAEVCGYVRVYDNARIYGNAQIYNNSEEYAIFNCNAQVYDKAQIQGVIEVSDNAKIYGNAQIYDNARIYGNAEVYDNAEIYNNAQIYDNAQVNNNAKIYDNVAVYDNAKIGDNAQIFEFAQIYENAQIGGYIGQSNVNLCNLIFTDSLNLNLTPHNGTPASASTLSFIQIECYFYNVIRIGRFINSFAFLIPL